MAPSNLRLARKGVSTARQWVNPAVCNAPSFAHEHAVSHDGAICTHQPSLSNRQSLPRLAQRRLHALLIPALLLHILHFLGRAYRQPYHTCSSPDAEKRSLQNCSKPTRLWVPACPCTSPYGCRVLDTSRPAPLAFHTPSPRSRLSRRSSRLSPRSRVPHTVTRVQVQVDPRGTTKRPRHAPTNKRKRLTGRELPRRPSRDRLMLYQDAASHGWAGQAHAHNRAHGLRTRGLAPLSKIKTQYKNQPSNGRLRRMSSRRTLAFPPRFGVAYLLFLPNVQLDTTSQRRPLLGPVLNPRTSQHVHHNTYITTRRRLILLVHGSALQDATLPTVAHNGDEVVNTSDILPARRNAVIQPREARQAHVQEMQTQSSWLYKTSLLARLDAVPARPGRDHLDTPISTTYKPSAQRASRTRASPSPVRLIRRMSIVAPSNLLSPLVRTCSRHRAMTSVDGAAPLCSAFTPRTPAWLYPRPQPRSRIPSSYTRADMSTRAASPWDTPLTR
ncbi:hypothetical protein P153DRAFT_401664 [Dothidotthia symphoricarpi CBS 119687]|uniref:Uncharacterized protein n=1 Tax=Dothidotthia symphoricarpi CBS 119687 TaxID=1392245 RepID=A0A6A5ZVZ4_9PLEO|nr:uncharacterized protein P153DRAFT_401664 [Dothidotthia symphoricarpi CBS 119687]KAF2123760.1 hypothetical protein P153DRAFT_401664 [Dothidotthia symphoricarpi CBS 119687]